MNVACNSPDTVSHRVSILLELQRLRTLLKVHPIELHAKLLRARASCLHSSPRTGARHLAREPANPRGGLMACAAAPPRRISWGWRACRGVNAHCQRFMCERRTRSGTVAPTTQTTLPTTAHCQRVSSRWLATWAAPPRGVTSPTVNCGTCASRGPVRDVPAGDVATKRGELHH